MLIPVLLEEGAEILVGSLLVTDVKLNRLADLDPVGDRDAADLVGA